MADNVLFFGTQQTEHLTKILFDTMNKDFDDVISYGVQILSTDIYSL